MKANQRDGPVVLFGILGSVFVAILTVIAVVTVVNKLNDNADKAYAAAWNQSIQYAQNNSSGQTPAITGPDGSQNMDGSGGQSPSGPSESGIVTDSDEEDFTVEDGETGTETKGENDPVGTDIVDVPSDEATNQDSASDEISPNENPDSEDDTSDSIDSIDIGSADGTRVIGLEYLSIGQDGTAVYHIVWGDTLSEISRKLGFDVAELADYNKIRDANLIYAESLLRVPVDEETLGLLKQAQAQNPDEKVHASVHTGPEEDEDL